MTIRRLFTTALLIFGLSLPMWCAETTYNGQIVPKDFISLCAPQESLKLPFYGSTGNRAQISSIEPEGKRVKAGDVVATFQFRMENAKDTLDMRMLQLKAKNRDSLLKLQRAIEKITEDLAKSEIRAQKAQLDLKKTSSLSRIKQKILECDFNLLSFEAKALKHKLKAARDSYDTQKNYCDKNEKIWNNYFDVYFLTKERYTIKSPTDGFLFYPIQETLNRKVRIGDRIYSGAHFLSIVKSDNSQLIFSVPEKDIFRVKVGDLVKIDSTQGKDLPAKIVELGFYPQLVGDVERNFRLPNAWDKCFLVKADIQGFVRPSSGGNVKVKPAR